MSCTCGGAPHKSSCPEFEGIRGIDNKRRLLGFFAASGHRNLVLRVIDILDLSFKSQNVILGMLALAHQIPPDPPQEDWRRWWLLTFPTGYVVIPIVDLLGPIPLEEVATIQQVIAEYRNVRQGKGSPCRTDVCGACGGGGCDQCDGGKVYVFLEMDATEQELARGEA